MSASVPPLNALRAFHGAAKLGSFAKAAEELNVTAAAVSHQIKLLEHWLGVKLFDRYARGVRLSAVGLDYADRVANIFDEIIGVSEALRAKREQRGVTIRAQYSFTIAWLVPRLMEFKQAHPEVPLRLMVEPSSDVPFRGGADLAIYHAGQWSGEYRQQILMQGHWRAYVSPDLRRRGRLASPANVAAAPLLQTTSLLRSVPTPTLEDWLRAAGIPWSVDRLSMQFNFEAIAAEACMRGGGVALLLDELFVDAIREGRLVELPGPALANTTPYLLLNRRGMTAETRRLRQWLLDRAAELRAV
jgi:LysR family transcriptional regulator, glycine cleavage system transcriptional activator